jgi:hypothetical protein
MTSPPGPPPDTHGSADPVIVRRRQVARWVSVAQRVGYALLGLFCVLVAVGFRLGFPSWLSTLAIVAIAVGSALLAPAIVLGYAVKAADREDRQGDWR